MLSQWGHPFFGLAPENREAVILEPFFLLGYYFGMSDWDQYYRFPVSYRRWLINRINEEMKRAADSGSGQVSKGAHNNTPDVRELTGKQRAQVPARLQRFT